MKLSQVLHVIKTEPSHEMLLFIAYAISEGGDKHTQNTVNSEIFARVLFSGNSAYAKFRENKIHKMAKSLCRLLI